MEASFVFVLACLLAVSFDFPSTYGASIEREAREESELWKRQGSFGGYGNFGRGGWEAGLQGGYKKGNTDINGRFGTNSNGQWGGGLSGSRTWNNGNTRLEGNIDYSRGSGPSAGILFTHRFRK